MESIDHLYYHTMECEGPFERQNPSEEEEVLYDEVIKTLNKKQKALFVKYADFSLYRHLDGEKECYHLGTCFGDTGKGFFYPVSISFDCKNVKEQAPAGHARRVLLIFL